MFNYLKPVSHEKMLEEPGNLVKLIKCIFERCKMKSVWHTVVEYAFF